MQPMLCHLSVYFWCNNDNLKPNNFCIYETYETTLLQNFFFTTGGKAVEQCPLKHEAKQEKKSVVWISGLE